MFCIRHSLCYYLANMQTWDLIFPLMDGKSKLRNSLTCPQFAPMFLWIQSPSLFFFSSPAVQALCWEIKIVYIYVPINVPIYQNIYIKYKYIYIKMYPYIKIHHILIYGYILKWFPLSNSISNTYHFSPILYYTHHFVLIWTWCAFFHSSYSSSS